MTTKEIGSILISASPTSPLAIDLDLNDAKAIGKRFEEGAFSYSELISLLTSTKPLAVYVGFLAAHIVIHKNLRDYMGTTSGELTTNMPSDDEFALMTQVAFLAMDIRAAVHKGEMTVGYSSSDLLFDLGTTAASMMSPPTAIGKAATVGARVASFLLKSGSRVLKGITRAGTEAFIAKEAALLRAAKPSSLSPSQDKLKLAYAHVISLVDKYNWRVGRTAFFAHLATTMDGMDPVEYANCKDPFLAALSPVRTAHGSKKVGPIPLYSVLDTVPGFHQQGETAPNLLLIAQAFQMADAATFGKYKNILDEITPAVKALMDDQRLFAGPPFTIGSHFIAALAFWGFQAFEAQVEQRDYIANALKTLKPKLPHSNVSTYEETFAYPHVDSVFAVPQPLEIMARTRVGPSYTSPIRTESAGFIEIMRKGEAAVTLCAREPLFAPVFQGQIVSPELREEALNKLNAMLADPRVVGNPTNTYDNLARNVATRDRFAFGDASSLGSIVKSQKRSGEEEETSDSAQFDEGDE